MQNRQRTKSRKQPTAYSAFDTALYYLTFRDRSRKEICDKLKEKDYTEAEIAEAMAKLADYGYVDDARYARTYIKGNMQAKGRRRIAMELSGKGVDAEVFQEVFSDIGQDETETIYALLEKRYGNLDYGDEAQVRRMYAFMGRRGFRYEDIRSAVSQYRKNYEK